MINGLYVTTSGMLMQQSRLDSISNNLANMNTNGYKKDTAVFSVYRPEDERYPQNYIRESSYNKTINSVVMLDDIFVNQERGQFKETGNNLDFALEDPNAFFAVDTPWGVRYTRNGEFTLNSNGELVTQDGQPVMSRNTQGTAPIVIDRNAAMDVSKDGTIYADGLPVENIMVVTFADTSKLQKVGNNMFAAVGIEPEEIDNGGVRQGFVEGSNVNPITEMVRMIDASRGYEMYAKAIQTHDDLMQQAASKIAGRS